MKSIKKVTIALFIIAFILLSVTIILTLSIFHVIDINPTQKYTNNPNQAGSVSLISAPQDKFSGESK